ncbi:MAG: hypothetical protein E6G33_10515 [Actinobacteria bacterium]|nr:MAG: hypothetical protein E6G33_10515 [Actinomycetota bacterium]
MRRLLERAWRGEDGGVLVFMAFWMPVAVLFMSLVIDVGHWFEHKRHLQLQADAAVLAAAGDYKLPCSDTAITNRAIEYGGGTYNAQVGGTLKEANPQGNVHLLMNSQTFYNQSSPVDSTVNTSPPCTAGMIDVKLTETDVPWFFKAANIPYINAHARIEIRQVDTEAGALPIAVPDINPKVGRAYFFDEANPATAPFASTPLTKNGTSGALAIWDNAGAPVNVPINVKRIGVRIALGGGTSTTCGDPLVECYDVDGVTGILYIRGYSTSGSGAQPAAPLARDVRMVFNGSCSDPYFNADTTNCTVGLHATIDAGSLPTSSLRITAHVGGTNYALTYNSANSDWETSSIAVAPNSGPHPVTLSWEETTGTQGGNACKSTGGNKCKGDFDTGATVQRVYSATDASSGPIKVAQLIQGGVAGADSFATGSNPSLVVRIGIKGNLKNAADVNDPIVSLRVVGNRNQSLDCDDQYSNIWQELAFGCRPQYTINTGTACPNQTTLWNSAQPWPCVAIDTGHATNEVPKGLNTRILGDAKASTCTSPNHWSSFPDLPTGDPRIVQVFLAPYGAFAGTGSNYTVPVENFATFYVTGWTGQGSGFNNPCQGNGDDPVPNNDPGVIVGHFIMYIQALNNGGGTTACDLTAFGSCVAVLTY